VTQNHPFFFFFSVYIILSAIVSISCILTYLSRYEFILSISYLFLTSQILRICSKQSARSSTSDYLLIEYETSNILLINFLRLSTDDNNLSALFFYLEIYCL